MTTTDRTSTTDPSSAHDADGVVVLFPGGHGKPQLRPFPYMTHRGEASMGTLVGEQQHHAIGRRHAAGRHPALGRRRALPDFEAVGPVIRTEDPMSQSGDPNTGSFAHEPVMLSEVLETFADVPSGLVVDATLGGAGHAVPLLEQDPGRVLLGIDRDATAVEVASARLARFGDRAQVAHARFDAIGGLVDAQTRPLVGALFDLGVSSHQLDEAERGFSHRFDAPLDMRMDRTEPLDAAAVVNGYEVDQLRRILRELADEVHARRIAEAVVAARPVLTTRELADVVRDAVPAAARRSGRHPAMKTFQAIRIEVNRELDVIQPALEAVIDRLVPGGRIVVISYHSGEDRIVKHVLRQAADGACECPSGLPCICGAGPSVRLLRRKIRRPEAREVELNPRAASARFRSAERLPVES